MHPSVHASDTPDAAPPALDVRRHALFLDLDGTLAPIVERPSMVQLSGELRDLLKQLNRAMNGAVAVITGRTIKDADAILGGCIEHLAGVHGFEVRRFGKVQHSATELKSIAAARVEAEALLRAGAPGAFVEDKTASIALHYRQTPMAEHAVREIAHRLAERHGLRTLEGKMVIELVAGAHSKAHALECFLQAAPFAGRAPVAVGDDLTDEHAFTAANERGGFAVLVGEPRPSAARYWLRDPAAVTAWLAAALKAAT